MTRLRTAVLVLAALPFAATLAARAEAPRGESRSLYQIEGAWTDQNGRPFALASLRGSVVVLALFYGTCDSVCPSVVRDMKKIEALLPEPARARTRFVLVTIDPAVDTPERLLAYARESGLDPTRWTLLNGPAGEVRVLANVLGIKQRPTGGGQYSHTIRINVLDLEGALAHHADGLDRPLEPIAKRVSALLAGEASGAKAGSAASRRRTRPRARSPTSSWRRSGWVGAASGPASAPPTPGRRLTNLPWKAASFFVQHSSSRGSSKPRSSSARASGTARMP